MRLAVLEHPLKLKRYSFQFRQLICLSCAMKRHSEHEFVLYEHVMDDVSIGLSIGEGYGILDLPYQFQVRGKCRDDLNKLQISARDQCNRARNLASEIAHRMGRIGTVRYFSPLEVQYPRFSLSSSTTTQRSCYSHKRKESLMNRSVPLNTVIYRNLRKRLNFYRSPLASLTRLRVSLDR